MLQTVIIDDEKYWRDSLADYLSRYCSQEVKVVGVADSLDDPDAESIRYVTWVYRAEAGDGPPWSGGFLTWPAYHYVRYRTARSIIATYPKWRDAGNQAEWVRDHPDEFRIVAVIQRERNRLRKIANGKST